MGGDPWAGMVDPREALKAARAAAANSRKLSQEPPEACESGSVAKTEACEHFRDSRNFRSPPEPVSQFRGEKSKQKSDFSSSSYIEKTETYPIPASPDGLPGPGPELSGDRGPAKVAKARKCDLTHSDRSRTALATPCESFAVANTVPSPTAHLSGPLVWRDGLARLDRWAPPCEGFRFGEWEAVYRAIAHFMDHYAAEAEARGWTALDLFGVHGRAGAARVDSCGALMLPWRRNASSLTAEGIRFGPLAYRRRALPEAVLAWDYAGGGWREATA